MDETSCALTKTEWDQLLASARISYDLLFNALWRIEKQIWGQETADRYIAQARIPFEELLASAAKLGPHEEVVAENLTEEEALALLDEDDDECVSAQ